MPTPPRPRPRLFASQDLGILGAVASSGLTDVYDLVADEDVVARVVISDPAPSDVVLLRLVDVPNDPLSMAARLAALGPARILVVVGSTRDRAAITALRFGADDVILEPVDPRDLALRVRLVRALPERASRSEGDVFDLLHDLTNVVGAMQLTAYLVAHSLPQDVTSGPSVAIGGAAPPTSLDSICQRLEIEVSDAIDLVREIELRVRVLGPL